MWSIVWEVTYGWKQSWSIRTTQCYYWRKQEVLHRALSKYTAGILCKFDYSKLQSPFLHLNILDLPWRWNVYICIKLEYDSFKALPQKITEQFNSLECASFMGILPEIDRWHVDDCDHDIFRHDLYMFTKSKQQCTHYKCIILPTLLMHDIEYM